jgi:hypothetical protein
LIRESRGSIDCSRTVQTYWNVLCMLRRQETGRIDIDPVTKHQMFNVRRVLTLWMLWCADISTVKATTNRRVWFEDRAKREAYYAGRR